MSEQSKFNDISIKIFVFSQTYACPYIISNCVYTDEKIQNLHQINNFVTDKVLIEGFIRLNNGNLLAKNESISI